MKYLIGFLLCITVLFGETQKLVIDSTNFETNDLKGLSIFTGDVKLRMDKDKLNSDKLEIFVKPQTKGKAKKPLKYIATGNVDFEIFSNGKHYKGKGSKVTYNPNQQEYVITGNGYLKEVTEDRELYGEKIFINQLTGSAKVSGSKKKPVRFILNIDNGE